jgi:hypothetical protein
VIRRANVSNLEKNTTLIMRAEKYWRSESYGNGCALRSLQVGPTSGKKNQVTITSTYFGSLALNIYLDLEIRTIDC